MFRMRLTDSIIGATIVDQVQNEMTIAREEIFGPVLNVMRMDDLDHAIELANKSAYGNGAAIFTNSGKAAREFKHRVKAGMVGINVGVPGDDGDVPIHRLGRFVLRRPAHSGERRRAVLYTAEGRYDTLVRRRRWRRLEKIGSQRTMSLLIKNGEIVTPNEQYIADIFCEGETITRIEPEYSGARVMRK